MFAESYSNNTSRGDSEVGNGNKSRKSEILYTSPKEIFSRETRALVEFWSRTPLCAVRSLLIVFSIIIAPGIFAWSCSRDDTRMSSSSEQWHLNSAEHSIALYRSCGIAATVKHHMCIPRRWLRSSRQSISLYKRAIHEEATKDTIFRGDNMSWSLNRLKYEMIMAKYNMCISKTSCRYIRKPFRSKMRISVGRLRIQSFSELRILLCCYSIKY